MDSTEQDVLEKKLVPLKWGVLVLWFLLFWVSLDSIGTRLPWYYGVPFSMAGGVIFPLLIYTMSESTLRMKLGIPNNSPMRWYFSPIFLIVLFGSFAWILYG